LAQGDHGVLEQRSLFRVSRKPVEPLAAEHLVERWLSGADRMEELLEGKVGLAVDHAHKVTGACSIGAQHGADIRYPEATGQDLTEDAFGCEKPQHAIKRIGIRTRGNGQFLHRLLVAGQEIGDAEFNNDPERL
jgi:hypothetical protein